MIYARLQKRNRTTQDLCDHFPPGRGQNDADREAASLRRGGKATARHAVSDWMELEKQRGISITSSVMQFEYEGYCINILDTPGHQDFSEDTYRTLMAADSAVMVIDAAKGIEPQTRKLFKICAMRHIPIFTFINKLDREARSPYELMEELEKEFGIGTYPMNWPIGCGSWRSMSSIADRARSARSSADSTRRRSWTS